MNASLCYTWISSLDQGHLPENLADCRLTFAQQRSPESKLPCRNAGSGTAAFHTVGEELRACT